MALASSCPPPHSPPAHILPTPTHHACLSLATPPTHIPLAHILPAQSFVDGSTGPGEVLVAPWSAVCLAVLLQRSSDKAAVVRAKALGNLAEALETFG